MTALLAASACSVGETFALYPEAESATVAGAPWPSLLDVVRREAAAGPPLDPATGTSVTQTMSVEAALAAEESARLSPPVLAIEPLRAEAAAARAGRR